ncbi:MAG: Uma2 family endonuclease [Pseudanabaena sp. ELA607]
MVVTHASQLLPLLENGDRLNRNEFERRYAAAPDIKKAELIEGVVYVASPLRFVSHAQPHSDLIGLLWTYKMAVDDVFLGNEPTVRLDGDNEPQPDIVLFRSGGSARIDEDGYIVGAPELVVEIAASTTSYDLHDKKRAYQRNGIKEYLVWRTFDRAIDWFVLEDGRYIEMEPDPNGIYRSREFAGLWLNIAALLAGDMATVLRTLQEGIGAV